MDEIGLFEAKNRLAELVRRAESGEEIVITRRGRAVARIVASTAATVAPADPAKAKQLVQDRKSVV